MRADGMPWPTVPLAPAAPAEGETVVAMGYPMGLPFTVTRGIVSGLGHRGNLYVTHMQTDAAINPGNSGGPLFNLKGQVVGVNTQIYTMSGGSQGLGFAITAPDVAMILAQYAQSGNIATAALGIIVDLSDPNGGAHLVVEYARWGSAAEKAGLRRGDIIAMVNGQPIMGGGQPGAMQVAAILAKLKPGDKIQLGVIRGDQPVALEITLDPKHDFASR
jgi:serine protease Do